MAVSWLMASSLQSYSILGHVVGFQRSGPFLGPQYNLAPKNQGAEKETILLATSHVRAQRTQLAH